MLVGKNDIQQEMVADPEAPFLKVESVFARPVVIDADVVLDAFCTFDTRRNR